MDREAISQWAEQVAKLRAAGKEVVFVTSGSIVEGTLRLGLKERPSEVHELQAAAAVGQMGLAQVFQSCFAAHGLQTAQVLLTHDDLSNRRRYLNARATVRTLLDLGVVPVVNENDTVVTDEIKFGDNDTLAALVTNLIEAHLLVILTDQEGLYTADPRKDSSAVMVGSVSASDPTLKRMASGEGGGLGKGGMQTKVVAARRVAGSGAHTIVASGRQPQVLERLAQGEVIGTQFISSLPRLAARKQWLAGHLQERGEVVVCENEQGDEIARGLINYSSEQARRIVKTPSSEIAQRLGFVEEPELIHRSNMVLLNAH